MAIDASSSQPMGEPAIVVALYDQAVCVQLIFELGAKAKQRNKSVFPF